MSEPKQPQSQSDAQPGWTGVQAYMLAAVCLLLGVALGYLFHGSASPAVQASAPAAAQQDTSAQNQQTAQSEAALAQAVAPFVEAVQKNPQDFALGKAEHPEAREFTRPFRKRNPGIVVDNTEGNDGREPRVDARHRRNNQRHRLAEVRERRALQRHAAYRRHCLDGRVEFFPLVVVETEVDAADDGRIAHQARQRLQIHHAPDAKIVLHQGKNRESYRSPRAFQQVNLNPIPRLNSQDFSQPSGDGKSR